MRGFLQRIAASVARRELTVHPYVGSMFQSAPRKENVEAPPLVEAATDVESVKVAATPTSLPEPAEPKREANLVKESSATRQSAGVEPRQPELLAPRRTAEVKGLIERKTESKQFERQDVRGPLTVPEATIRRGETECKVESKNTLSNQGSFLKVRPLVSLLVEEPRRPETIAGQGDSVQRQPSASLSPISALPGKGHGTDWSRSPQIEKQTTEDIQIHIGRIEVVAERQAPAPPPPKPIRRSLNLQDYLKHRDRRGHE